MRRRALETAVSAAVITATAFAMLAAGASAKTVWLCFPGHHPDPCTPDLSTTVYSPALTQKLAIQRPKPVVDPAIDCFYVYPTVTNQRTGNADLQIDPQERSIALYQAARYSQYCRVFAPMYRQVTIVAKSNGAFGKPTTKPNPAIAYSDVRNAFLTYLASTTGAADRADRTLPGNLRAEAADRHRGRLTEARRAKAAGLGDPAGRLDLVVGGDGDRGRLQTRPSVPVGQSDRVCDRLLDVRPRPARGCAVRASGVDQPEADHQPKPAGAVYEPGRTRRWRRVITPIQPSQPFAAGLFALGLAALNYNVPMPATVWWTAPGSYRARCETVNGATVLMISSLRGAPLPTPSPSPVWGLHLLDAQLALANLVADVKTEAAAFLRSGS